MACYKTFAGDRLDITHYSGYPIVNHEFEILDDAGLAYDFTNLSEVFFKLFAKAHGKELNNDDMELQIPSTLLLSSTYFTELRPTLYYHECYWTKAGSPDDPVLLFYGVSEVI